MVIKYRVISGSVTVTGPPASICFLNKGMTEPRLPSTLPKRTVIYFVSYVSFIDMITFSATRFVAPITLVGLTALSVEIMTNRSTPWRPATSATFLVP